MNTKYEVLIWKKYEYKEQLGSPQQEILAKTYLKAITEYNKVDKYMCKMLMVYDSLDDDSDGEVIEEDWNE